MKYRFTINGEANILATLEERICDVGSADRDSWGGTWEGGYRLQQNPCEFAALIRILLYLTAYNNPPTKFEHTLDIGTAAGGSTRVIREMVPIDTTTIIDDGKHEHFPVWQENRKHIENLTEIIGDSHAPETIAQVRALDRKFSLISIDGDHSYEGVKADFENYQEFFADEAVVWFHDTVAAVGDVGRFWFELKSQGHYVLLDTGIYPGIGAIIWKGIK